MDKRVAQRVVLTVAKDRLHQLLRSPIVIIGMLLTVGLAVVSSAVGAREFEARQQQHLDLVRQLVKSQVNQALLSGSGVESSLRALRPPPLGIVLAHGRDPVVPVFADFAPAGTLQTRTPSTEEGTGDLGALGDLESILRLIGGLFAVSLGVHAVMRSKQTGWLWSMGSLPLEPWHIVLGLWLGCCLVGWLAVILCVAAAVVATSLSIDGAGSNLVGPAAVALPTWLLYMATMSALGAMLSIRSSRQARTYAAAVLCWLVLAWLGPQFATSLGQVFQRVVPRMVMEADRAERYANAERSAELDLGQLVAAQHPTNQMEIDGVMEALRPSLDSLWQRHALINRMATIQFEDQWQAQRDRQEHVVATLAGLFPGGLVSRGVTNAMDTGDAMTSYWRTTVSTRATTYDRMLFDDRPRINVRVQLDRGIELMSFVRRPRPLRSSLPVFEEAVTPRRLRYAAVLQADVLLMVQLVLILVLALTIRPSHLRPAS